MFLKLFLNFIKKFLNSKEVVNSNLIGINEWFIPQISEHCPKERLGYIELI